MGVARTLSDRTIALGLFGLGLLTRIPLRTSMLYHWDSVNFALAIENFDIRLHQPHPPGYVLYIALARLANTFLADANASLVWVSILFGCLSLAMVYLIGKELFSQRVGLIAAVLFLTSPLFWFLAEVALPYAAEAFLVTVLGWVCYRLARGKSNTLWWSAVLLGLIGGFRPQATVLLFPLWLWAARHEKLPRLALALVFMGITILAWLVPMALLSGGLTTYFRTVASYTQGLSASSPLTSMQNLFLNFGRLGTYLFYAAPLGLVVLAIGLIGNLTRARGLLRDPRAQLLLIWIVPPSLVYAFVYLEQAGHIVTLLPGLFLLLALAVSNLAGSRAQRGWVAAFPVTIGLIVTNLVFFAYAPAHLFGRSEIVFSTPSLHSLQERDAFLRERVSFVTANFAPSETAVLADQVDFRHPSFYLRQFRYSDLSFTRASTAIHLPADVRVLVLFDDTLVNTKRAPTLLSKLILPNGDPLYYVRASQGQQLFVDAHSFGVETLTQ